MIRDIGERPPPGDGLCKISGGSNPHFLLPTLSKIKVMTYQEKKQASKGLLEAIKALGNDESIKVIYGKDYNGQPQRYKIGCTIWKSSGPSYSIYKDEVFGLSGMNIDSLTNTQAKAYTYDMMGQRTTYNFPLYEMEIVTEKVA